MFVKKDSTMDKIKSVCFTWWGAMVSPEGFTGAWTMALAMLLAEWAMGPPKRPIYPIEIVVTLTIIVVCLGHNLRQISRRGD
jgi:hypothetical protein